MRYYTTADFFKLMREVRSNDSIKISSAVFLKNVYRFAAKNKCITQKQLDAIEDISSKVGISLINSVFVDNSEVKQ